jgi:hypothetical protein
LQKFVGSTISMNGWPQTTGRLTNHDTAMEDITLTQFHKRRQEKA